MSSSAITGPVFSDNKRAPAGTAAAPSFAFNDSTGTGVYLVSAGVLGLSTNGVQRVVVDASGAVLIGGQTSPSSNNIRLMVQGRSGGNNGGIELLTDGGGGGALFSNNGAGMQFYTFTGAAGSELLTERMRIDAAGRILKPYQPAFRVGGEGNSNAPDAGDSFGFVKFTWTAGANLYDRTSNFNKTTGRFTAPVAGAYYLAGWALVTSGPTQPPRLTITINGNSINRTYGGNNTTQFIDGVFNMNAGDYAEFGLQTGVGNANHNGFCGYFLG